MTRSRLISVIERAGAEIPTGAPRDVTDEPLVAVTL
jgi:hypothetical protein